MKNFLVVMAVLAVACGGKKDDNAKTTEAAKPADTTKTEEPKAAPPAEMKPPEPKAKEADDFTHGFCHVAGTGAVTFDQKSPHTGGSMLNVMQWHSEDMRSKMGYDKEGMILNCAGPGARISIMTGGKDGFPTKPGTYKFGKGGGARMLGSVTHESEPKNGLSILTKDGTLEITAFDDKHIAGKGEFTARTLPDKGAVTVTFDFDMQCYGLSGCVK